MSLNTENKEYDGDTALGYTKQIIARTDIVPLAGRCCCHLPSGSHWLVPVPGSQHFPLGFEVLGQEFYLLHQTVISLRVGTMFFHIKIGAYQGVPSETTLLL